MAKIFNIPASHCFVEVLAKYLLDEYKDNLLGLAEVLILLPNRRSCRSLSDAFVRLQGMKPTLLPQMRPVGDIKDDELILCGKGVEKAIVELPQAIDPLERKMLFMRLIMERYKDFGLERVSLAQAYFLSEELGRLIDDAEMYNLDWNNLKNLIPEEYAAHWQETLKFLAIITKFWPEILKEKGVVDTVWRKNVLIEKQSDIWQQQNTKQRIIVAGTTAVSPAMKKLVKIVLGLENGEVWLSGLDKILDDDDFEKIDETHPQFELKQLLDFLNIQRTVVKDLVPPANIDREKLISEILCPAESSDKWRNVYKRVDKNAVEGLRLIECDDQRVEALTIALLIRRFLEEKEKTVALITPDRLLARRVASELLRWDIVVDDSAGVPLAQTKWGIFMRLCVAALLPNATKEHILACMKDSFFALGRSVKKASMLVHRLDKNVWRKGEKDKEVEGFFDEFIESGKDFSELLKQEKSSLKDLLRKHILFAERISDNNEDISRLWSGEDGATGAVFLSEWLEKADVLGVINTAEYSEMFEAMMRGVMVRYKGNTHRRVRILGPMEARLNHFDKIILGGFNEGVWPISPEADPWMSRPMKKDFGFEQPERKIGVLGLDFANLLGAKDVFLTRAKMNGGTPTIKSRWWMRLETVLRAAEIKDSEVVDVENVYLANMLDAPVESIKITAPAPKPPVSARPRKMSASAFEKLLRDPYSVFAEYILRLRPLDELEKEVDIRDFGTLVHGVLEKFGKEYHERCPENIENLLQKMGIEALEKSGFTKEKQVFWRPKMEKMMQWIAANEKEYRANIVKVSSEVWGSFIINDLPAGSFEIYAKADRVDETKDGKVNIIDYKTGRARTATEVKKGYAPQLPIEGLIAKNGGFDGIKKADVNSMMYWKLGDKTIKIDDDIESILNDTKDHIIEVVNLFDFETTGYLSRPNPKSVPEYSDYEHLARVKEWAVKDDGDDE